VLQPGNGPGKAIAVELAGQRIAVFNVDGTYCAIGDTCTHQAARYPSEVRNGGHMSMAWGAIRSRQERLEPPALKVHNYKVVVGMTTSKLRYRLNARKSY
jgi:hypothetical protein